MSACDFLALPPVDARVTGKLPHRLLSQPLTLDILMDGEHDKVRRLQVVFLHDGDGDQSILILEEQDPRPVDDRRGRAQHRGCSADHLDRILHVPRAVSAAESSDRLGVVSSRETDRGRFERLASHGG